MSISDSNKIDVKGKALTGQRVVKITNKGVTTYMPVGLSSTDPNGPMIGVDPSVITTTADQVLDSAKYMTSDGVLEDGAIQTLSSNQYTHTPTVSDITIQTKGKYCSDNIVIKGDSDLVAGNIREGVNIFGVTGTLKQGTDADLTNLKAENIKHNVTINGVKGTFTSDADATKDQILQGFTAYVKGTKVYGSIPYYDEASPISVSASNFQVYGDWLQITGIPRGYHDSTSYMELKASGIGLTPSVIKAGSSIMGVSGTFTADATATSADILADKTAYVDGKLVTGMLTVSSGGDSAGIEFYECASVSTGGGLPTITFDIPDAYLDAVVFNPVDPSATGSDRAWICDPVESETGPGVFTTFIFKLWYPVNHFGSKTWETPLQESIPLDGHWVLSEINEDGSIGWTCACLDGLDSFTDANMSVEDIAESASYVFNGSPGYALQNPVIGESTSGGSFTWSGYKMAWSEGQAGDGLVISGADDNTYLNGEYALSENNGIRSWRKDYAEFEGYVLNYYTENPWGDIPSGWVLFNEGGGSESYYVNQTAGADATLAEICAGPWLKDWGGGNTIPTFTPMGTPAGWSKTDELVDSLEIKGYTPEVGKVYAVDSTIAVAGMYPAEIATGGGESGSTVPYIEVSGAGSTDLNGKYYMKDANATGGSRAFALEDGSAEIFFDNTTHLTDIIGWMISKPGSGMAAYVASGNADMSVEEICSASWSVSYGGTAPAPTLTYNSGSGSSDSGNTDSGSGGGLAKPAPGAANAVVALKITYDNGTIDIIAFSPEDLTASDNARRWLGIHTPTGNVWTLLNEGDWCLKDQFTDYYLYGVFSTDPWDGDWSTVKSNIGNVSIECTAIEM